MNIRDMSNRMAGKDVTFTVSEPEEFYLENGDGPFSAQIVEEVSGRLIIEVNAGLRYQGKYVAYLVASVRHSSDELDDLVSKEKLIVNFLPILRDQESEKIETPDILAMVSKWRQGHLVGDLYSGEKGDASIFQSVN